MSHPLPNMVHPQSATGVVAPVTPSAIASIPPPLGVTSPMLASPAGSLNVSCGAVITPGMISGQCSTLFVANLGQFCSEQELKDLFSRCAL